MRILYLPNGWTLLLCFAVWTVINLSVVNICLFLPDGGGLWKKRGYKKRHLEDLSEENLERFLLESCRAELTHWLVISLFWVFGFFLPASATGLMLIIALLGNLPCIIPQRYNRPRVLKLLERTQSRRNSGSATVS